MNCYSVGTTDRGLPCSKEMFEKIEAALEKEDKDTGCKSGFSCELEDGKIFIFSEESVFEDSLSEEFTNLVAELIRAEKGEKNYLNFGVACYGSRSVINSTGGYDFRIYDDGSVQWPEIYWPDDKTYKATKLLARIALADADTHADFGKRHGYTDEYLCELREWLQKETQGIEID